MEQLGQRENFVTLLHCLGLLSIQGVVDSRVRFGIPNQTVRRLMYGYLRDAYRDVGVFSVDHLAFEDLTWAMARDGRWRPAVDYLARALRQQTSVRDYVQGERLLQGFLAAYLGAASCFVFHTEQELGKGYADMVLAPLTAQHPSLHHGFVIELKYLKRSDEGAALANAALDAAKGSATRLPRRRTTGAAAPGRPLRRDRPGVLRLGACGGGRSRWQSALQPRHWNGRASAPSAANRP